MSRSRWQPVSCMRTDLAVVLAPGLWSCHPTCQSHCIFLIKKNEQNGNYPLKKQFRSPAQTLKYTSAKSPSLCTVIQAMSASSISSLLGGGTPLTVPTLHELKNTSSPKVVNITLSSWQNSNFSWFSSPRDTTCFYCSNICWSFWNLTLFLWSIWAVTYFCCFHIHTYHIFK